MEKKKEIYLYGLSKKELREIIEGLVLRDEIGSRLTDRQDESQLLNKISSEFTNRENFEIRDRVIEELDHYIDHEIEDELSWQGIEDELRKNLDE